MRDKNTRTAFRKKSVFKRVLSPDPERKRVHVHRTLNHIYASCIDDNTNRTLAAISTLSAELKEKIKGSGGNVAAAKEVGLLLASKLKEKKISKIYFDRGGKKYHGRVKAVAEALRSAGIQF